MMHLLFVVVCCCLLLLFAWHKVLKLMYHQHCTVHLYNTAHACVSIAECVLYCIYMYVFYTTVYMLVHKFIYGIQPCCMYCIIILNCHTLLIEVLVLHVCSVAWQPVCDVRWTERW